MVNETTKPRPFLLKGMGSVSAALHKEMAH